VRSSIRGVARRAYGRWDLLGELRATSVAELSAVLERVRKIKGIETTETSIHLQTVR
jgi:DNA-binding Lrp family transcriptional regulator